MLEINKMLKFTYILLCLALLFSLLSSTDDYFSSPTTWGLKIDNKLLKKQAGQYTLNFDHDHGADIPNNLILKIKDKKGNQTIENITTIRNNSISHKISVAASKVKQVILQSPRQIKMKANGRILQTVDPSPPSFDFFKKVLPYFFSICRNIIIIATITNTFDPWMPFLMFIQTFICLGFWTHDAHTFTQIYNGIFNSKYNLFNLVRILVSHGSELSSNSYMAGYGFTNKFILNASGQVLGLLVLIAVSIAIKLLSLFTNSEKLRQLTSKIRSVWNGYFFWMSPSVLCHAGMSLRTISKTPDVLTVVHGAIAAFTILVILVFFISLVIQIKKINGKLEYIALSRYQIGLAFRIDYMKQFQFDCLEYSMLHYPSMNFCRLIFAHLCIGFAPDFHYVQFGGVIAAQVFYLMIQISCSGYNTTRHKVLNPILDFLYIIYLLCFIGIGLVYGVSHLQLTVKLQIVAFTFLIFMLSVHIIQTWFDIRHYCQVKNQDESEQYQSCKDLKTNYTKHDGQYKQDDFSTKKETQKSAMKPIQLNSQISSDGQASSMKIDKKVKVKKIKNGKYI